MRRNTYRVVEYGGRHSGHESRVPTSDELVLDREDLTYVLKALRRGNDKDREFAKKMFDTLLPHVHCDCCGRRLVTADQDPHLMYGKNLCYKCWFIMGDIDYLRKMGQDSMIKDPMSLLKSTQKAREEWCPRKINYLVNDRTFDRCVKKYEELFGYKVIIEDWTKKALEEKVSEDILACM